jgi:RNA polymerase sigma-70 factor (ECF subfamily)
MPDESPSRPDCAAQTDRPSADLSRWVAEHHVSLYRYAFRLTGSVPDAEDLTQQTFLIAQQKMDQVRDAEKVRAWLFSVLRSCFLKSLRKKSPLPAGDMEFEIELAAVDRFPRESEVDGERLQAALNGLADEFRVVLAMFYFEEYSYKEIAERLEVPMGTVMSRLSRAKRHLRNALLDLERKQQKPTSPGGEPARDRHATQLPPSPPDDPFSRQVRS